MSVWSAEIKELGKLFESFKGQIPDLEKELGKLIKADDENMVLLYSRRALEVIITDLCECELNRERGSEPLKGIIDKLNKEKKVPSHIASSMYGLNELSTYGTHPKDFDPEQVKPVLINLEIIIRWYIRYRGIIFKAQAEENTYAVNEPTAGIKKESEIAPKDKPAGFKKYKLLSEILIILALLVAILFAYPNIIKRNTLEKLRSSDGRTSVAVMPFLNMTNDTVWDIWQLGIQANLTSSLSNYSDQLKVRQTESVVDVIQIHGLTNYSSLTPSLAGSVSRKLDASIFISGSINQSGDIVRINAQLVDTKKEEVFKSFQVQGAKGRILPIIDSLSAQIQRFLILKKLKEESSKEAKSIISTASPEAFRLFMQGYQAFQMLEYGEARKMFKKALDLDSNFVAANLFLAVSYGNSGNYDEAKKWCLKAYEKREMMPPLFKLFTNWAYACYFETPNEEIKYMKQISEIDDELPTAYYILGYSYNKLRQYENAIRALEKALEIRRKWGSKPSWVYNYLLLGDSYHMTGRYRKEEKLYKQAEVDFPDNYRIYHRQVILAYSRGNKMKAEDYINRYIDCCKAQSWDESSILLGLGSIHMDAGFPDTAEKYYREALNLEPENPEYLNALAWLLIDKERNLAEGINFIDKALSVSPDDYVYIGTKGWGLYKQGRYEDALKLLLRADSLKPVYDHELFLHLKAAKKAVADQNRN